MTVELASTTLLPPPSPDLFVIAISATGASVEVLAAAGRYAVIGRLVAITNRAGSPITELADIVVPLAAGVEESSVACRTYRHTFVVLAQVLTRIGGRFSWSPVAVARSAARANESLFSSSSARFAPVSYVLLGLSGTFVLAPANRLSSPQQSSLMLREVPRRPALGSETGDWAHVDVYLTKTVDYRALLYAGSDWDDHALQWMSERGSTVVSVGRDLNEAVHSVRYEGDEDRMTASLSELLVAELVAWDWGTAPTPSTRGAHAPRVDPGLLRVFRTTDLVVSSTLPLLAGHYHSGLGLST